MGRPPRLLTYARKDVELDDLKQKVQLAEYVTFDGLHLDLDSQKRYGAQVNSALKEYLKDHDGRNQD